MDRTMKWDVKQPTNIYLCDGFISNGSPATVWLHDKGRQPLWEDQVETICGGE